MKTIKIKHVNGPALAIITLWHRFATKQGDVIEVNEMEWETLATKEFNDIPVFELVKETIGVTPIKKPVQSESLVQMQDQSESVEG
jgi:hypothetical protein